MTKKKLTKNKKKFLNKIEKKEYSLEEGISMIKKITFVKFDSSIDLAIRLKINKRYKNQILKGIIKFPHGLGKHIRILALVPKEQELKVKESGADYVGLDYINKLKSGWTNVDIIIAIPSIMHKLLDIGKILGPKGLMPNPKLETVTNDPCKAIQEIKSGKRSFKSDHYGIIHSSIGKISFSSNYLLDNANALFKQIIYNSKESLSAFDGIHKIYISSTMSNSILITLKSLAFK
ncbi:50S ribosomal protein L1 [Blattabacterium cuenoti]|uniref:50S ribosomal protein L1 n=1 Tax=Blattabacterium cuenoti TaxID=1653831 RepID=UPI00163CECA8|nr:50S ribosomal protein L1 [Blattabacterium cuenoti]